MDAPIPNADPSQDADVPDSKLDKRLQVRALANWLIMCKLICKAFNKNACAM